MWWSGLFSADRRQRALGGAATAAAVVSLAVLFVGWELLTHFPAHHVITSNRTIFIVAVFLVGLTGSIVVQRAFIYLDKRRTRASRSEGTTASPRTISGEARDLAEEGAYVPPSGSLADVAPLTLRFGTLRWIAILAPAGLFIAWESVTHFLLHELILSERTIFLITVVAIGLGATIFSSLLFRLLRRMQQQLVHQNQELASRAVVLEVLYEIGTDLSAQLDVSRVKATAIRRARQLLRTDTAGLALLHEPTSEVRWELLAEASGEELRNVRLKLGECVGGRAIQSGQPVIVEDVTQEVSDSSTTHPLLVVENLQAALVVPVRIAGKPIGAMMVGHRTPYSFQLNDLKLLMSLANQVAVAINNAHLHEQLGVLSALEERERLAREMHDGVAQLLGNVTARAAATGAFLEQGRAGDAQQQLKQLRDVAQEAYSEVRQSILGLRTRPTERGLLGALDGFVRRITEQEGMPVHLEAPEGGGSLELTPEVEVQALRIIQEALANVRKHAQAQEAWVRVRLDDALVVIEIRDNGRGFDPSQVNRMGSHFGLATMRERAEGVGGHLSIESAPGEGTSVMVQLPVGEEE